MFDLKKNNLFNVKSIFKITMQLKLVQKFLNILLQKLMRMGHFKICRSILKFIKKLIPRKLLDQLKLNFAFCLFYGID